MMILRSLLFLLCLVIVALPVQAQTFDFPQIPAVAADANGFVPKGWKVLQSVSGDLNKDTRPDCAIVIQREDEAFRYKIEGMDVELDSNYRMTIVGIQREDGKFDRKIVNTSFVMRHLNADMEDPFEEIKIEKGVLKFYFRYFMTIGGWETSTQTFVFRWQKEKMALIGMDNKSFMRNTGDGIDDSYNFNTMKHQKIEKNEFDESIKPVETWTPIKPQTIPSLDLVGPADEFYVKE